MRSSEALRETTLAFYDRFSANDVASFDELVSTDATLFVGTAEDEWFVDREKLRSGFGYDGLRLEGGDPQAWEEGDVGWVADRPTMHVPELGPIRTRFTGVFRREHGRWRLVLSHFSVGVPDSEVADLQRRFPN
jgi:ketosteroid isomerase-like protein